jgi:3,4-dihydroxy 2-butanone 4-phosphate synthase/GTP cyclohydrolase II
MTLEEKIELIVRDLRAGKPVIIVDDEKRENEGDLVCAAEFATPENVNFMVKHARGLLCVALEQNLAEKLQLNPMVSDNTSKYTTAFTVSIDAKENISTGISAFDRSVTIKKLIDSQARPQDFVRPGHVFPLLANDGGVLKRDGHTEAVVDIMKIAGLQPVGALCEIMSDDGNMARAPELGEIAEKFNLSTISIRDIILYRKYHEELILHEANVHFPTQFGDFRLFVFSNRYDKGEHHLAIVKNADALSIEGVLCRVHSECFTGDVLASYRCDCGEQLEKALEKIEENGSGAIIYMRQEGRGIGLINKIKAYELQDAGYDTVEANHQLGYQSDMREYYLAAQIMKWFKIKSIRLMTNNPEKIKALEQTGIIVTERVAIEIPAREQNKKYLNTKKRKMGHILKSEI